MATPQAQDAEVDLDVLDVARDRGDRAEKCRHEPQLDNWRSAVQLEALLGQRAAGGRV